MAINGLMTLIDVITILNILVDIITFLIETLMDIITFLIKPLMEIITFLIETIILIRIFPQKRNMPKGGLPGVRKMH